MPALPAGGDNRDSAWQSRPHPQMPFLPSAALNARPFYPGNMGEEGMARKRDGLVPVEEAISDLDGPVKKLPRRPRRFTTSPASIR